MSKFKIFVDTSSARFFQEIEKQRNILCNFYISLDDWIFPSLDWLDFPVIVLGWWLEGYINSLKGEIVENSFMNGPFGFTSVIEQKSIKFDFFQETKLGRKFIASYTNVSVKDYEKELLRVTNNLLTSLEKESLLNQDIQNLKLLNKKIYVLNSL